MPCPRLGIGTFHSARVCGWADVSSATPFRRAASLLQFKVEVLLLGGTVVVMKGCTHLTQSKREFICLQWHRGESSRTIAHALKRNHAPFSERFKEIRQRGFVRRCTYEFLHGLVAQPSCLARWLGVQLVMQNPFAFIVLLERCNAIPLRGISEHEMLMRLSFARSTSKAFCENSMALYIRF